MTPDKYRQKYKSCYTCEYYQKADLFKLKHENCKIKNRELKGDGGKKCKAYKPLPFEEENNE